MYNNNIGWTCPKCGRTYTPWQTGCLYCNDSRVVYAGNTNLSSLDTYKFKDENMSWRDYLNNDRRFWEE